MHLFGDSSGPHLAHFHARRQGNHVELDWELRNAPTLHWRVLRSEHGYAAAAEALPGSGQTVLLDGTQTHVKDDRVGKGTTRFYTVFAQDEQGAWRQQVKAMVAHADRLHWLHPALRSDPTETGTDEDDDEPISVSPQEIDDTLILVLEAKAHPPLSRYP